MTDKTQIEQNEIENDEITEIPEGDDMSDMNDKVEEVKDFLVDPIADDAKLNMKFLADKLNEIIEVINTQGPTGPSAKDLKSERAMTEDDARRVLLGDLKELSHKDAAEELSLSYGQIYSARKGFTFKTVYKEYRYAESE